MKIASDYIYSLKKSLLFCTIVLLSGCGEKNIEAPKETPKPKIIKPNNATISDTGLYDKLMLSQNPLDYVSDSNESAKYDFLDQETVKTKLFMVWDSDFKASVSESLWVLDIIKKDGYKENLITYSSEEKSKLVSDIYSATSADKLGIIARNTDIRAFPTKKPYFYDPKKAGEGYPFDNLQASRIYVNTPVKIAAISPDGAFYYIASSVTDGWVDSRDVAIITSEESSFLRGSDLLMSVGDKVAIFDKNGRFIEKMQVGSFVFEQNGTIYSAVGDKIDEVEVDKKRFVKFPLAYSPKVFATLSKSLMNEAYGWGGMLDNRDCSMFLRDLFLPFGLYLPRNSYAQAKKADGYIDLSNMSEAKRLEFIKQKAKPFTTFLYLKGHILLYLGVRNDEIVALHDVWGFAYDENGTERRHIVGRPVITTLFMGQMHDKFIAKKSISSRLLGIRVLE